MREKPESKTSYVQFDELQTSERSQLLPVTIALAVRPKNGDIISARIAPVEANALKRAARHKYGIRSHEHERAVREMLGDVKQVVRNEQDFTIVSDRWLEYRAWVEAELPFARYENYSGAELRLREKAMAQVDTAFTPFGETQNPIESQYWVKRRKNGKLVVKAFDPLFSINQKCARLRAAVSRLRKHWWSYTQKLEYLEHHLWLFIAVNNGYKLRY
jgi:hypothetical protein